MINVIKDIPNFFLDIFFPKLCVGCGTYGRFLCFDCAGKIENIKTSTCPECGKISKYGRYCPNCKARTRTSLGGILIAAGYDAGPTKEIIHHLKYSGFIELSELLGEILAQRLVDSGLGLNDTVIVPVPLHKKKEKKRGFNQAELMAKYISKKLNIPGGNSLVRVKNTETQVGLRREERIKNLTGAFICDDREFVAGKTVILVDDVTTSGTTLNECGRVLKEAGAKRVFGLVVARRI